MLSFFRLWVLQNSSILTNATNKRKEKVSVYLWPVKSMRSRTKVYHRLREILHRLWVFTGKYLNYSTNEPRETSLQKTQLFLFHRKGVLTCFSFFLSFSLLGAVIDCAFSGAVSCEDFDNSFIIGSDADNAT